MPAPSPAFRSLSEAERPDLLVIAGEHSGDENAARMVAGFLARRPGSRVFALGGPRLAAAGARLLLDLTSASVVGFGGVLRNLGYFRALQAETLRWIGAHRPKAVCFVDYSGFNLRIAESLRLAGLSAKGGGSIRLLYYVSPQIWASRPNRRFSMGRDLDALAAIFPFEAARYADTGLPVTFVGHPFCAPDYAPPVRYDPAGPVLLLPGSRRQAVRRIFPAMLAGHREAGSPPAVVLYPSEAIREVLEAELQAAGSPAVALVPTRDAPAGGQPAAAVLTTSGTMSMHCALAGIPGAIVYRIDPLTYLLGRLLVTVPYLGIANILLEEPMYPEFIQGAARPAALASEIRSCLGETSRRTRAAAQAARLRTLLSQPPGQTPGDWLVGQVPA